MVGHPDFRPARSSASFLVGNRIRLRLAGPGRGRGRAAAAMPRGAPASALRSRAAAPGPGAAALGLARCPRADVGLPAGPRRRPAPRARSGPHDPEARAGTRAGQLQARNRLRALRAWSGARQPGAGDRGDLGLAPRSAPKAAARPRDAGRAVPGRSGQDRARAHGGPARTAQLQPGRGATGGRAALARGSSWTRRSEPAPGFRPAYFPNALRCLLIYASTSARV
jgi:hypothetical protein